MAFNWLYDHPAAIIGEWWMIWMIYNSDRCRSLDSDNHPEKMLAVRRSVLLPSLTSCAEARIGGIGWNGLSCSISSVWLIPCATKSSSQIGALVWSKYLRYVAKTTGIGGIATFLQHSLVLTAVARICSIPALWRYLLRKFTRDGLKNLMLSWGVNYKTKNIVFWATCSSTNA